MQAGDTLCTKRSRNTFLDIRTIPIKKKRTKSSVSNDQHHLSAQLLIHFTASTAAIFIRFAFPIQQKTVQFAATIVRHPLAFLAVAVAVSLRLLAPTHSVPVAIPTVDSPGLTTVVPVRNSIQSNQRWQLIRII